MKRLLTTVWLVLCSVLLAQAQKFEVDTILYHGPSDKYINFVFLADGYQANELSKYIEDVKGTVDGIFAKRPFRENKVFFNVFAIKVPSKQSGASHPGTASDESTQSAIPIVKVDNYFGSTFDYGGIHRLLVPTNHMAISSVLASNFPEYDQVFVLVNSPYYGGSGGAYATSSTNVQSKEIAIHEIGHSFANLADEYWAGPQYARERPNMTQVSSPETVKWKQWLNNTGVGIYPYEESPTWYRPHQRCSMRYLSTASEVIHFCMVCHDTITKRIASLMNQVTIPDKPGKISGPSQVCAQQDAVTYSISPVSGAGAYTWTVPEGYQIIQGQGTTTINVRIGPSSGQIGVAAQNFNGQSASTYLDIQVQAMPVVKAGQNENACLKQGLIELSGFSPAGGAWSGIGTKPNGIFDPALAGLGTHQLTYTYSENGCSVSATKTITVYEFTTVSLADFQQVCSSTTNFQLTGGSPAGGTYGGNHVQNGVFNAAEAGPGTHRITYTYANVCSITVEKEITVSVCTNTNEAEVATGIQLFPNPASTLVQLEAQLTGTSEASLQVYDPTGKLIFSQQVHSLSGILKEKLNLSKQPKGIYLLRLSTEKGHVDRKLLLQ
ncbi:M64 family metallopeptidase [Pontibacter lucknowensis]|uniref:Por secretion system C-terminal sorting domain-containing protein n=1 Tax=Pontibacter lucknowensis TaxID=1077936 RepID=A0A1N6XAD2_9BACT|nr:M64 family metallopeptidase [Pontibacter lucknowensis]SIQ99324.1 Por secretion system C-terminal sorting domain-containing protein [Pontibacter lucknowensis]